MRGPKTGKACVAHRKEDEVKYVNNQVKNGLDNPRSRFGHECTTKENMGTHGQTCITMVPYSVTNGELTKDFSHGKIARGENRY